MKDDLGQRMKEQYEERTRIKLPRRSYTIIRLDGKAFHTYTKNLQKPFDHQLSKDMDRAIINTISQIQGAKFAYTQSDEISILLTDFEQNNTSAWFDGNIQKITSVSASIMTAEFNKARFLSALGSPSYADSKEDYTDGFYYYDPGHIQTITERDLAYFDSRVFTIPDREEVLNYFIWRNQDMMRNSVSMVAQSLFSHKELHGKSTAEKQEMIFQKSGKNWSDLPENDKNGHIIERFSYVLQPDDIEKKDHCTYAIDKDCVRSEWRSIPAWRFTQDRYKLDNYIPNYPNPKQYSSATFVAMELDKREPW